MKKCSDGSQTINISKYKTMLPLAMGNIDITIEGEHDVRHSLSKQTFILKYEWNICFY